MRNNHILTRHGDVPNIIVIGIGNDYRCDDAVGLLVARRLRLSAKDSVKIFECYREGTALIDLWDGGDTVFLVDAVFSDSAVGSMFRKDLLQKTIAEIPFRHSTHSMNIVQTVEFARVLNKLPNLLIFYGIEGGNFSAGEHLTPEVERAFPHIVTTIQKEISDILEMKVEGKHYA